MSLRVVILTFLYPTSSSPSPQQVFPPWYPPSHHPSCTLDSPLQARPCIYLSASQPNVTQLCCLLAGALSFREIRAQPACWFLPIRAWILMCRTREGEM